MTPAELAAIVAEYRALNLTDREIAGAIGRLHVEHAERGLRTAAVVQPCGTQRAEAT